MEPAHLGKHGKASRDAIIVGLTLVLVAVSDAIQIIGGSVTAVQGHTAVFPCKAIDTSDDLRQITWQRLTREKVQKDFFFTITEKGPTFVNGHDYRFEFVGDFSRKNGTLRLSNVTILDEGTYTCIFTLSLSGNHQTVIPLKVLVPPNTSLKGSNLTLGDKEVVLATCTATRSKPPTEVTWLTGTLKNKVRTTINSTLEAYDTTTTINELIGVPTREISDQSVQCVINNTDLLLEETLSVTLKVFSPPKEVNISESAANIFKCQTEGYPTPVVTWSRPNKPWPLPGVRAEGATLHFSSPTSDLNGLYVCEATNAHGRQRGQLTFHYTSGSCPACWTLFTLLLILIAAASAVGAYLYRSGKLLWKKESPTSEMGKMRDTPGPSEENPRVEEDEHEEE
ncbi:nectin-1-like isoform X2 [Halichoeres trimaculatus]|uniref:nectin-1-like isoform X2 n=1 Tax=Halichoeres trimaculatus TaxID=147232 RepID=UPI003D9E0145